MREPGAVVPALPAPPLEPARPLPAWAAALLDRVNPIVIKEIRQGLRTRLFWICFSLLLFACFCIATVAFATSRDLAMPMLGRWYFLAFFDCLGVVQFFVIPYSAYRSLAREREDETWVLLSLTGLGPRRILRGKLTSFVVQAGLYASAAAPFLLFSYYLNGIDLPTILVVLALGWAYQVFLTAAAVSAATLAESKLLRALAHFVVLGGLGMATLFGLGVAVAVGEVGSRVFQDEEFYWAVGAACWAMVSFGLLLFEAAAARLSLTTEDYAKGPRLVMLGQLAGTAALFVVGWLVEGRDEDVALAGQLVACAYLAFVGLFFVTDQDGMARCHRARPGVGSWLRPGALRGFRWVMLALGLVSGLFFAVYAASGGGRDDKEALAIIAAPAYAALYLSLALLVSRLIRWRPLSGPAAARAVFALLVFLGSTVPPLLAVLSSERANEPTLNLFNPFVGLVNIADGRMDSPFALGLLVLVAVGATLAADRVLAARDREGAA